MKTTNEVKLHTARKISAAIKRIRKILKLSQAGLGETLGLSKKAIESYEQGWRNTPPRVLREVITILALNRQGTIPSLPCWEIKGVPIRKCMECPSMKVTNGQFCWFMAPHRCRPRGSKLSPIVHCLSCKVVKRLMVA